MVALVILLTIVALSILVTRIASVALVHTGLTQEAARFQARSAFTGVGFTTREAEGLVEHPIRRRIVELLMLAGNAGLITSVTMLILAFVESPGAGDLLRRGGLLVGGLFALLLLSRSEWVDQRLAQLIGWALERYTELGVRDYYTLLHLQKDYSIARVQVSEGSWLSGLSLGEAELKQRGIQILGIERSGGSYQAVPRAEERIEVGDTLVAYGTSEGLEDLSGQFTEKDGRPKEGEEPGRREGDEESVASRTEKDGEGEPERAERQRS